MDEMNFVNLEDRLEPSFFRKVRNKIEDIYHTIGRYTFNRYDTIKSRQLQRGKYYDKDYMMFHFCFQLLCDYVEKEEYGIESLIKQIEDREKETKKEPKDEWERDLIDWNKRDCISNRELIDLYKWYNITYVELESSDRYEDYKDLSDIMQEKLESLVRLRGYLWT